MTVSSSQIATLIAALAKPEAYPFHVIQVEVRQTHISAVFLAGEFVYKLKKPVKLPFLDFTTLEQRRWFCDEEVRINRRLAPEVYLGVVPVCETSQGVRFEGPGRPIDWAVKMARLPDLATFASRLEADDLTADNVVRLAEQIAEFHSTAPRDTSSETFGAFRTIAHEVRDNLIAAEQQIGRTISSDLAARLRHATETALEKSRATLEERVRGGFTRELHGDLHLDHIYLFPDQTPPDDLVIIDAIEFSKEFRWIDVVADMAFCVMDFIYHGRRDLAAQFADEYFARTSDSDGRRLLPLFTSYRAAVRAKVEGITVSEAEVAIEQRDAAARQASAHWLIALGELESPMQRPALVLVSGLPGTGKSTIACGLAETANFKVIRSDVVRKELSESSSGEATTLSGVIQQGLYSPEWTERTYAECLLRAADQLRQGGRVIVDATFLQESFRERFLTMAIDVGVPARWLVCEVSSELARQRLELRQGDASDADWAVYQHAASYWELPSSFSSRHLRRLDASGTPEEVMERATGMLRNEGLA